MNEWSIYCLGVHRTKNDLSIANAKMKNASENRAVEVYGFFVETHSHGKYHKSGIIERE